MHIVTFSIHQSLLLLKVQLLLSQIRKEIDFDPAAVVFYLLLISHTVYPCLSILCRLEDSGKG